MYIQKTQGISARETCPDGILVVLVNGEMGFEKLAEKLERHYARATVSKYLTELFDDGSFVRRRSRRGNYYLTEKGRKKAKTKQFVKQISEISDEFTEQFILNYKDYVMNRVKNSLFFPYNTSSKLNHGLLPPSECKKDLMKWKLSLLRMTIRPTLKLKSFLKHLKPT